MQVNEDTTTVPNCHGVHNRVAALEDRLAILGIEGAYGPAYDGRNPEGWAALFTADGVYETRTIEGAVPGNRVQGRENLARFCREEPLSGIHLVNVPHIVLDGDRATVRVHFQFFAHGIDSYGRAQSRSVLGYYDAIYIKVDGEWLIDHRVTNYVRPTRSTEYGYEPEPSEMHKSSGGADDLPLYQDARG